VTWFTAFVWTCALEQPVYIWALRGRAARWWEPCAATLMLNLATHPILWSWALAYRPGLPGLAAGELLVVLVEAAMLAAFLRRRGAPNCARRGLIAAAAANACSWGLGRLIFR
jgi:hypothetical protein